VTSLVSLPIKAGQSDRDLSR